MQISRIALAELLQRNVVEVKFVRRHKKYRWPTSRRMLCTNDQGILKSAPGMLALGFKVPTNPPPYNPADYNLICVYDLFWQEWRSINCDDVDVISVISTRPPTEFWKYFREYLKIMTPSQKIEFMKT